MREMQQEILDVSFCKTTGGRKIQVPQVRQPEEQAGLRQFLLQNFQKKLSFYSSVKENSNY
jgi:hypothetical protein